MKTTPYFEERVLRKRPYLVREWCIRAIENPVSREVQPNGRVRYWTLIDEIGKHIRVVTLEDGETIHNALPDRRFSLEG